MNYYEKIAIIEECIKQLKDTHPYSTNMKIDRKAFATARCGYEAAISNLEKYMRDITEEIEDSELLPKSTASKEIIFDFSKPLYGKGGVLEEKP